MIRFDDSFVRELPGDREARNVIRQVRGACYSHVTPTPVARPEMIAWVPEVAALLDLERGDDLADVIGGNRLLPGMRPYAACYGGHQFGAWAGQLGDGRAITLGEIVNARGERWEIQLKGAGRTPYSRGGDGRAVLRSSLRELVCSEAMFHLGVPTTRALALVTTGEDVVRDMFYDGNPGRELGAIVCRVAPTFLRFGNYEIFAARKENEILEKLVRYAMKTHFAAIDDPAEWLAEIARRTAVMIAHWMRVGFVHGVMNTDNMSILGLTIDYGPYGWLEGYDPGWTPNTTDAHGRRYRFGNQPRIALWNLACFAEALGSMITQQQAESALQQYADTFAREQARNVAAKLGWRELREEDDPLVEELFALLSSVETDMTIFFRLLADVPLDGTDDAMIAPLARAYYGEIPRERLIAWLRKYAARADAPDRRASMNAVNPKYVPRNWLCQLAIDDAARGDARKLHELMDVFRHPYDEQPEREEDYFARRPEWARHRAGCSMLSCSS